MLIQMQVPQKQERTGAFISVCKRVIFDHEIQQMRRATGHIRIKQFIARLELMR